ncbi:MULTISPECIES: ABC transporter permease [Halomicrobium]|uniref:ABC transporter permease n=1 Tax=Halomicrobium mukohataei TaxID=57705 RepID=A0A4D6KI42_9EURY|nr:MULTISPECIES: ABC transporter permease [Halomicrobium]QCD65493.1 ABC transporter permease [Halomicrobium mukohataei]QFR20299.1 ABC transporter permease [Halomicrobium sp. ZPS1]
MGARSAVGGWASYANLIRVVAKRELLVYLRYPVDTGGLLLAYALIFGVIFLGGRALVGDGFDKSLDSIVVGFFLWTLSTIAFIDVGKAIWKESEWGTMERHFLTPLGFNVVLLTKALATLVFAGLVSTLMLLGMLVITGQQLQVDLLTIVPIVLLSVSSVFGIGFAVGGISVLYKKVDSWLALCNFALAGLVAVPTTGVDLLRLLPLAQGSAMLQAAMTDGYRLWDFDPVSLLLLLGTGLFYLVAGYAVFVWCQRRARRLAVLGDY